MASSLLVPHPPFPRPVVRVALLPLEAGAKKTNNMNQRPGFWHRTRRRPSFWLGLFVACFLAWAWLDSYTNNAWWSYTWGSTTRAVCRGNGASFIASATDVWFRPGLESVYGETISNPESAFAAWRENGARVRHCRVPDSLVFFSYVGLWIGWLTFSDWRRKTRTADLRVAGPGA